MKNFSTWMLVMFMILFWLFRLVVAISFEFKMDLIGIEPLNQKLEIILLFVVILCLILITIIPFNTVINLLFRNKISINNALNIRSQYSSIQEYKSKLNEKDLVYYISCGSNGFDFNVTNYELIPIKMSSSVGYSPGVKRSENDLKSRDISVEQLETALGKRIYLCIYF